MTTPINTCVGCAADIACPDDPAFPYSLTGPPQFDTSITCPPGYDCTGALTVSMLCCGQTLTTQIPDGASSAERLVIVQRMIDNCKTVIGCNVDTPPVVTDYFFSRSKSAGFDCPTDQGLYGRYTYTVPAGSWIATTQRDADALALNQAQRFVDANRFCLKVPPMCPCAQAPQNFTLPIQGGNPRFTATIIAGHFPAGATISVSGTNVKLTGTPRTPGLYNFTIKVVDSLRGTLTVPISVHINQIGYATTITTPFTTPAVLSTVTATFTATANTSVGDVVAISTVSAGNVVTAEAGTFQVMAVDTPSGGDVLLKNLTVQPGLPIAADSVVTWALTALPEFEQGVAYSFQLPAYGGTGSYAWRISSGSLPDGLTMSIGGLISGTPTGVTPSVINVDLVDLGCADADRTFYPPRVRLSAVSTKTVATIKGYEEWTGFKSTPPKKYKTITWTGSSEISAVTFDDALPCASARYEWVGAGTINDAGAQIASYAKNLYAMCPLHPFGPDIYLISEDFGLSKLTGYCWTPDTNSCPACISPPPFYADVSTNDPATDQYDFLTHGLYPGLVPSSSTVAARVDGGSGFVVALNPSQVNNFPLADVNGEIAPWVIATWNRNYGATLSDEYTDSIALAHASITTGNSVVALSSPRTTGFVSTWVTVAWTLTASNLVFGELYVVLVDYVTDLGVTTTFSQTFVASSTTHVTTGSVPTPANGHSTTVRNARIIFGT